MVIVLPSPGRRWSVIPLVALAVAGVGPATEAVAATVAPNPSLCSTPGSLVIDAQQGEAFTVQLTGCTGQVLTYDTSLLSGSIATGSTVTGDVDLTFTVLSTAPIGLHVAAITLSSGVSGSLTVAPAPPRPANGPSAWYQAYARQHSSQPCEATWHPSWAQWPNNHSGGPTCDRVYVYDAASNLWRYE